MKGFFDFDVAFFVPDHNGIGKEFNGLADEKIGIRPGG
jgi:hypothetical protein